MTYPEPEECRYFRSGGGEFICANAPYCNRKTKNGPYFVGRVARGISPQALTDPYVNLSIHTAPIVQPLEVLYICQ